MVVWTEMGGGWEGRLVMDRLATLGCRGGMDAMGDDCKLGADDFRSEREWGWGRVDGR